MVTTIRALTKNHCEYITCPFMISASCKSEDACAHMSLLSLAWRACNQKGGMTKGKVHCVASDGESRHGKALVVLTECTALSPTSPFFMYLRSLLLLHLMLPEAELMSDNDYTHVMKHSCHA